MITLSADAIMVFSHRDTLLDARDREFCRPPDQVYRHLASEPRVRRLLVADPWRSLPIDLVRRAQGRRAGVVTGPNTTHLRPMGLRRAEPARLPAVRHRYRAYARSLRRAAVRAGLERPAVVAFNPFVAAFAPMPWASKIVYYGRDDWTATEVDRRLRPCFLAAYAAIRDRGVTVCAVSRELADRVAGPGQGIVIPNGIDADVWLPHRSAPAQVRDLPRPCGVYAGTVDDRLDVDAVLSVLKSGTLEAIAIAGPVADPHIGARLAEHPGVHLLGALSQADLAAALMNLDVCLMPHVVTPLTKAMSPLKLYEYVASGTPVVSTDLPPVRDVDPRVVLVHDGGYESAVKKAMGLGRADEATRVSFIEANAWHTRLAALTDAMFGERER